MYVNTNFLIFRRFVIFSLGDLPESYLEDVSKYLDFIRYQYIQTTTATLVESDDEFEASMQQGFDDMKAGHVTPLKEAFAEIKSQFAYPVDFHEDNDKITKLSGAVQ